MYDIITAHIKQRVPKNEHMYPRSGIYYSFHVIDSHECGVAASEMQNAKAALSNSPKDISATRKLFYRHTYERWVLGQFK